MSQQANQFNYYYSKPMAKNEERKEKRKKVERKAVLEGKKGNFIFSFGIYFGWLR